MDENTEAAVSHGNDLSENSVISDNIGDTKSAEKNIRSYDSLMSCISKGISPEYAEDVLTLAGKYSGSGISVESAIDSVIEKYPIFLRDPAVHTFHGITTGVRTVSGSVPENPGKTNFIDVIKENQVRRK